MIQCSRCFVVNAIFRSRKSITMSTITVPINNRSIGGLDVELGCGILPPAAVMINHGEDKKIFLAGNVDGDLSSSSCSSIGKNSDDDDNDDGEEIESKYKCDSGSFDAIQALEEALPYRRGISRFYNGKSKSFTSLADTPPLSSVKEIVKPENAYTRKRKNLLASTLLWEENKKNNRDDSDERSSKRSCTNVSRTNTFAFTVAMNNASSSNIDQDSNFNNQFKQSQLNIPSSRRRNLSAVRSYSMADLQRCN